MAGNIAITYFRKDGMVLLDRKLFLKLHYFDVL